MKNWKKIVRILVLALVLIPTAAFIAVQIPAVQTALVGKVSRKLSKDLDGDIRVGKVLLSFPNNLILEDVTVVQGDSDTLAQLGKVLVSVKASSMVFSKEAQIRRVSIENGRVAIRHINDSTTNLQALLAPLKERSRESSSGLPWDNIQAGRVTLKHIDFSTDSLQLQDINLSARNIRYGDDGAAVRIDNLTLRETQRGLDLQELSGNVTLDSTGVNVRDLRYDDGHSNLKGDVALGFSDFSDFSDFLNRVSIDAALQDSYFDTQTLGAITGAGIPSGGYWIDGRVQGPVNDLRSDRLHVESASQQTALDLKFHVKGLPDIDNARINAEILNGTTTTADLADILSTLQPGFNKASLSKYAPGERISLTAKADGTLASLKTTGSLTAGSMGTADIDALVSRSHGNLQVEGNVSTESLQLGRLIGNDALGSLTARTDLSFSSSKDGFSAAVSPLDIERFSFRGYDYHGLRVSGRMRDGMLQADISSDDPNLQLVAHGDIDLGGKGRDRRYRIGLDLGHADLDALHFDPRDSSSIRLSLDADLIQTPQGAFLGQADILGLQAMLGENVYDIGDLALTSTLEDERYGLTLESSVARATYEGNLFFADFVDRAVHLIMEDNLLHLFDGKHVKKDDEPHPEDFGSLQLRTLDLQPLLDFFTPGIYVSRETNIGLNLINDEIQGTVSSELSAVGNNILRNLQGRFYTEGERLRARFDADRLQAGSLTAENVNVDAVADSSFIDLKAAFRNEDGSGNRADLHTQFSFLNPESDGFRLKADILPSTVTVAGNEWEILPATLRYRDKTLQIDNFMLCNGEQSMMADGVVGERLTDTVRVRLNDFDLGLANSFLSKPFNLQGLLTGEGEAFALLGPEKGILLNLRGQQISAVGHDLGDLKLLSRWDDASKHFKFLVDNTFEGRHPISATAFLRPSDKQAGLDLELDRLAVGIIEPILADLVSGVDGSVSGHIKARGPLDRLSVESDSARFNNLKFKLLYTQVDYLADGPFTVSDSGVTFDDITIYDTYGHQGRLTGGIPYDHFKDIRLNARIDMKNVHALNTTSRDNDSFYGKAFADGTVRLSGPLNKIRLNLNLTPKPNTSIHIPLGSSAKKTQSLLTFINNEEKRPGLFDSLVTARQMIREKKHSSGSELSVNFRLNATPDAEILLEIDKNTGDILKARGNGQIGITSVNGSFDIKGDYRVDSGSYHFGMLGFTARDFSINPGGTIDFNGDVMQTDLDLTATYHTKASISPLIADSTAVNTRRNVECGIGLTGKLANPEIKFNIEIPDLDPTTLSRVQSALNTEDKRMKQALALLVSGGFVPDEQSGIVNSTTLLYSNASEMMANQLNNIFRQLDIPIDLGFNYQPTETGRDIFDVAVSTQLFNNRVSINGNIGNRQYLSSSTSDIVGDLDIEIKLNRQGQWRLTLFSHSADQYSNYLDQSQRNGAGIVYQEDFNTIGELWRKLFHIKRDERQPFPDSNPPRRPRTE